MWGCVVRAAARVLVLAIDRGTVEEAERSTSKELPQLCPCPHSVLLVGVEALKGAQKHISRDWTAKMKPTTIEHRLVLFSELKILTNCFKIIFKAKKQRNK